jgi:CheY-like chemotaxis protein
MPSLQPVILLAEDNENDISMLRRAFRQARLPALIHQVSDGDEAIEYLEGKGKHARRDEFPVPDLLLLDLKMPRRSGLEVISWVRRQPFLSALRIVVLTTSEETRDINEAYRLGANSFLTKPILFDDFKSTVGAMYEYWLKISQAPEASRTDSSKRQRGGQTDKRG